MGESEPGPALNPEAQSWAPRATASNLMNPSSTNHFPQQRWNFPRGSGGQPSRNRGSQPPLRSSRGSNYRPLRPTVPPYAPAATAGPPTAGAPTGGGPPAQHPSPSAPPEAGRQQRRNRRGGTGGRSQNVPQDGAQQATTPESVPRPSEAGHERDAGGHGRGYGIARGSGRGGRRGRGGRGGIRAAHTTFVDASQHFSGQLSGAANVPKSRHAHQEDDAGSVASEATTKDGIEGPKAPPSTAPDLPTRIHEDIDSGNYMCPICLSAVKRSSRIWACNVCWHVVHNSCFAEWVSQSRTRYENGQDEQGDDTFVARCPACNTVPLGDHSSVRQQHCWCGKAKQFSAAPAPLPPHSCGRLCGKSRLDCPHPCSAVCHAGPCPPCTETGEPIPCFCGKHVYQQRCDERETAYGEPKSCRETCDTYLPCGVHTCQRICHPGGCGACVVPMPSVCFCGRSRKTLPCRLRAPAQTSYNHGQGVVRPVPEDDEEGAPLTFEGTFQCEQSCERPFDCGVHRCTKPCHAQDAEPAHCPFAPDVVTHCPCGKTRLSDIRGCQARSSCQDEIPHCDEACGKPLPCGHPCPQTCHGGACRPCAETVAAQCACGQRTEALVCGDVEARATLRCDTVCGALLSCKTHKCRNLCCPGRPKAAARQAAAKGGRQGGQRPPLFVDIEEEHLCARVCGRPLACGQHTCPQLCHRGACLSCAAYITDATLRCPCGRTVLPPPFPCGTTLPPCEADCTRAPPCGHPAVPHRCHDDTRPCPRCPQLVTKACLCGKFVLQKVACGTGPLKCDNTCGKLLKCGVHKCRSGCHAAGECEDAAREGSECGQVCGRPKPLCGHPCQAECHGLSDCNQEDPCNSGVVISCECGRRKQKARCKVCTEDPSPTHPSLKCDDECLRLQRNAALKTALSISDAHEDEHVPYANATLESYLKNRTWAAAQEQQVRAFAANDGERRLNFRPMNAEKRKFLHLLAEDFGLGSESKDPEPHRHVSLFKTNTFASGPAKTLAQSLVQRARMREKNREAAAAEAAAAAAAAAAELKNNDPGAGSAAAAPAPSSSRWGFSALRKRRPNAVLFPAYQASSTADDPLDNVSNIVQSWADQEAVPVADDSFALKTVSDGTAALKVSFPTATPGAVDSLLRYLLSYMVSSLSGQGDAAGAAGAEDPPQICLCHLDDESNTVLWREGDADHQQHQQAAAAAAAAASATPESSPWSTVASRTAKRDAAAQANGSAAAGEQTTAVFRGRAPGALLKLKKAKSTTVTASEERRRRMAILAQQPADDDEKEEEEKEKEEEEEEEEEEAAKNDGNEDQENQEVGRGEEEEEEDNSTSKGLELTRDGAEDAVAPGKESIGIEAPAEAAAQPAGEEPV